MDLNTGRPDHIEDALIRMHTGSWFYWTDSKNKIFDNLKLHKKVWNSDGTALIDNPVFHLPTEVEVNNKLAELQAAWDLEYNSYKSKRRAEYPKFEDQFDQIYNEGIDAWKTSIKAIKDKYPKPS
tara:strand:+ start:1217 stop:1591 length:375 start_codon:yes stop_codon:yes gene_type:complete